MRGGNDMKPRLLKALDAMKRYNAGVMSRECFGFEPEICYDALVVATAQRREKELARTLNNLERIWDEYEVYEKVSL